MSIPCEFDCDSISEIQEVNSTFARGKLKVMYLGNNQNGSHFSKYAVQQALPSLKNVPIVCHWDYEAKEIGGHDIDVVTNDDGTLRLRTLTEPCGVVPDHATFSFVSYVEEDGSEHEYLVIDGVLLWKRQDVYQHIVNDLQGKVKHSMEIVVHNSEQTKDGFYDIKDFEFTALCLLENCQPCFQGSELELFSTQNFKQHMEQMMSEMRADLNSLFTDNTYNTFGEALDPVKGGEKRLDRDLHVNTAEENFTTVASGITATPETINIYTSGAVVVATEENESAVATPVSDINDRGGKAKADFALEQEFAAELIRVLRSLETVEYEWGEWPRYSFVDYDKELQEVYCFDNNDYLLYGFPYETNGDNIIIVQEKKKRMKCAIVDFDEGEQVLPFAEMFEEINDKIKGYAETQKKYKELVSEIDSLNQDLTELRQYKKDAEQAAEEHKRNEVFSRFIDLDGISDFESLKENAEKYDVGTIEEKCFAIRGKNMAIKFSENSAKSTKLMVEKDRNRNEREPYGGIFAQYGIEAN